MRVVIVSRVYAPEPGAATLRLSALERALVRRGLEVEVVTTQPPHGTALGTPDGSGQVQVRRWPALRDPAGYIRGYLPYASFDIPAFWRVLLTHRPDVVVVEPPPTTGVAVRVATRLRRIPYVYYAADIWSEAAQSAQVPRLVVRALRAIERWAWRGARAVITVYPALQERMSRLAPGLNVRVVGHGADTTLFRPDGPRAAVERPYVVYAGTASEVHGAGIFVEAFHGVLTAVPDAMLVVLGQGEERAAMEEAARNLPRGATLFLGRLDPATTAGWIRGARAALASVRPGPYDFALATKVFAAAACGTPVLYAGPGDGGRLVEANALGWAVPYSVDAVRGALVEALSAPRPPEVRDRLAVWAREHASLDAAADRAADVVLSVARRA